MEVIELRAIAEKDDILKRPVGAALCPNIYSLKHLKQVKEIEGSYNWESLYQQRPIARKGGIIQYDWIEDNWYDKIPEKEVIKTVISWDTTGQPIIDELKRLTTLPIVEVSTQNLDKEVRLDSVSGLFESGKVHFPERAPWLIETKDQLCLFPSYKFDDIVDSVVHFLRWTNKPRYVRKKRSQLFWK